MCERLRKVVNDAMIMKGIRDLAKESKLSETSIREIAEGARVPRRRNAYRLALACDRTPPEALELAYECGRTKAIRTA